MVVARQASTVVIATGEDLEQLRETLDQFSGERLILDLNPDSDPVLSTVPEFRSLAATAFAAGVQLTVSTEDPVRQELARFAGVEVDGGWRNVTMASRFAADTVVSKPRVDKVESSEGDAGDADDGPRTEDQGPEPANGDGSSVASAEKARALAGKRLERHDPFDTNASFSFVITPPVPRRPDVAPGVSAVGRTSAAARPSARSQRRRRATALIALAVIAVVAIIAALIVGVVAPYARVTLVPAVQPVSSTVTYGVAGAASDLDVAIEPATIRATLTYEATIPSTGERFEPDGAAAGSVTFTNPSTLDITVPAGTLLMVPGTDITFVTSDDVTVPAADPFGAMTFGSASVEAIASQPGEAANVAAGAVTGQLDSGVFYTNRGDMTGGTVKRIPVVSEADVAKARADAEATLAGQVDSAIEGEVPTGYEYIDGSTSTRPADIQLSHEAGQDAEALTVNASMVVEALVYDPEALRAAGGKELDERLASGVPEGFVIVNETLERSEPRPIDGASGLAFTVTATSSARADVTPGELDRLRADLVGADEDATRRTLAAFDGLERYALDIGPDWLPVKPIPRLESRIEVNVEEEAQPAPARTGEAGP